jgi:hypothetical protein
MEPTPLSAASDARRLDAGLKALDLDVALDASASLYTDATGKFENGRPFTRTCVNTGVRSVISCAELSS